MVFLNGISSIAKYPQVEKSVKLTTQGRFSLTSLIYRISEEYVVLTIPAMCGQSVQLVIPSSNACDIYPDYLFCWFCFIQNLTNTISGCLFTHLKMPHMSFLLGLSWALSKGQYQILQSRFPAFAGRQASVHSSRKTTVRLSSRRSLATC